MSGWDFKRKGCEILQRDMYGWPRAGLGQKTTTAGTSTCSALGCRRHTQGPLLGCGEDVGVPLPVTQDETGSLWLCDLLSQMTIMTTTGPL